MVNRLIEPLQSAGVAICDLFITSNQRHRDSRKPHGRSTSYATHLHLEELEALVLLDSAPLVGLDDTAALVSGATTTAPTDTIVTQAAPIVLSTAGQTYQLQTSLRFSGTGFYIAAPNVTIDLNGHTIFYGGDNGETTCPFGQNGRHAVVLYSPSYNSEITIPGAAAPDNATIKNGSFVDEGTTGVLAHAISGYSGVGFLIQNIRAEVYGTDSATIWLEYGNGSVLNSVLISHTTDSFDRMAGPANVWTEHCALTASGNVLIGGNSGFNVGSDSQITRNVISQSSPVTNGYGVFLYGVTGVLVQDNLILPSNGRGVIINGDTDNQVLDNVILHLERPNAEFGDSLNAPAFRSRYHTYGNTFTGNTTLGIAGADRTSASGLYLGEDGTGAASVYENNNMTTILVGTRDTNHYAQPLTLEDQGYVVPSQDVIQNNVFRSNDSMIRVQGWDGSCIGQAPLVGNSLSWVDGNTAQVDFMAAVQQKLIDIGLDVNADAIAVINSTAALISSLIAGVPLSPDRATWFVKYYGTDPVVATALDSQTGPGVPLDSYAYWFLSSGTVSVRVGQTVSAILIDASGAPLANVAVQVTTDCGDVYSQTTDAAGKVDLPTIEFALEKAYAADSPVVKNARTTTTLTVGGFSPLTLANSYLLAHKLDSTPLRVSLGTSTDPTPPTVTSFSPAGGSTNVATNTIEAVTFSEAMTASSINTSTVLLMDGSTTVAATVAYNVATQMVTLTPSSALAYSKNYTIVVKGGAGGVTDLAGNALVTDATASFTTIAPPDTTVAGTNLWYKNSTKWNVTNGATFSDDNAIAPDKTAFLPNGTTSAFSAVSSYDKGINGLMIDLSGAHGVITANDFIFKVGNNNSPSLWDTAAAPTMVTTRAGAGSGGSDRIELVWADNAIQNTWLEVIVKGNDALGGSNTNTGLLSSGVFFWGSAIGDAGVSDSGAFQVSSGDEVSARNNSTTIDNPATLSDVNDINRDGLVNSSDQIISQNSVTTLNTQLKLLMVGADGPFAPEPSGVSDAASPAVAIDGGTAATGSGDVGLTSGLAANTTLGSGVPVGGPPPWRVTDLQSIDLRHRAADQFFEPLAAADSPLDRQWHVEADNGADQSGLDDELLIA
jgi:hypothetical protein